MPDRPPLSPEAREAMINQALELVREAMGSDRDPTQLFMLVMFQARPDLHWTEQRLDVRGNLDHDLFGLFLSRALTLVLQGAYDGSIVPTTHEVDDSPKPVN